jgi:hypothetical protein
MSINCNHDKCKNTYECLDVLFAEHVELVARRRTRTEVITVKTRRGVQRVLVERRGSSMVMTPNWTERVRA